MRKILLFVIGLCTAGCLLAREVTPVAQLPAYYESIDGTSGKALLDAIQQVAKIGYRTDDFRYDSVWFAFKHTDLRPDRSGRAHV